MNSECGVKLGIFVQRDYMLFLGAWVLTLEVGLDL